MILESKRPPPQKQSATSAKKIEHYDLDFFDAGHPGYPETEPLFTSFFLWSETTEVCVRTNMANPGWQEREIDVLPMLKVRHEESDRTVIPDLAQPLFAPLRIDSEEPMIRLFLYLNMTRMFQDRPTGCFEVTVYMNIIGLDRTLTGDFWFD